MEGSVRTIKYPHIFWYDSSGCTSKKVLSIAKSKLLSNSSAFAEILLLITCFLIVYSLFGGLLENKPFCLYYLRDFYEVFVATEVTRGTALTV